MIIAQISDTHIALDTPDARQRINDFERTIAGINALDPAPDLIVHTGDIVHNGRLEEYAQAGAYVRTALPPHRWREFLSDCNKFLTGGENWAGRAAELGWNAATLFGYDRDEVWPLLLISFGGICAQRRLRGSAAASFEHLGEFDREQREDLAKAITESPDEARQLLNAAQAKAAAIIDHGWPAILRLADALMLRGKLDDHEIRIAVTGGRAWRRRASWDEVVARSRAAARGA